MDDTERDRLAAEADDAMHAGWHDVADRMDRWAANGYRGDWTNQQYETPAGGAR